MQTSDIGRAGGGKRVTAHACFWRESDCCGRTTSENTLRVMPVTIATPTRTRREMGDAQAKLNWGGGGEGVRGEGGEGGGGADLVGARSGRKSEGEEGGGGRGA